jgi:RND family efflux transporter MFP subunit
MPDPSEILRYAPPRRLKAAGIVALCVAALLIALGLITRVRADQRLATWTNAQVVPTVKVVSPKMDGGPGDLVLPGDIEALNSAPIYARVPGYLKRWYADIGTPVKAGQVLADIDTPELDHQLAQAKADLATAVANQHLADTTATRWAGLLAQDAASHQDADVKNGDLAAKTALVASARANVERLQALEGFKRITAPFSGVVTTRSTDIGALISVGAPGDIPLFTVADEHRLRIYVHVPQSYSADIKPGMTASFDVPQYPGRTFTANLSTTADAVTPQNGTLLVQLQRDNDGGALKPGDYAQVRFGLTAKVGAVQAPASALMFRDSGMVVAVVGPDGRAVIKPIRIGQDRGAVVEIATGLSPQDRVIDNPPDSLRAGDPVRVAPVDPRNAHAGL